MAPVVVRMNDTSSPCALWLNASVSLTDYKCPAAQQRCTSSSVCHLSPTEFDPEKPHKVAGQRTRPGIGTEQLLVGLLNSHHRIGCAFHWVMRPPSSLPQPSTR